MRFGSVAAIGAVVVIGAACSGSSHRSSSAPATIPSGSTSVATTAPSPLGTTGTVAPPTTTTTTTTAKSIGTGCPTSSLTVSMTDQGAAAGTAYRELVFKNISTRACVLQGYPGVSFVDSGGHQIGAAVPRMSGPNGPLNVVPGATAAALFAYHDVYVATIPGCQPTTAVGVRVYPPNQTASVLVASTTLVCANPADSGTAGVGPLAPLYSAP